MSFRQKLIVAISVYDLPLCLTLSEQNQLLHLFNIGIYEKSDLFLIYFEISTVAGENLIE